MWTCVCIAYISQRLLALRLHHLRNDVQYSVYLKLIKITILNKIQSNFPQRFKSNLRKAENRLKVVYFIYRLKAVVNSACGQKREIKFKFSCHWQFYCCCMYALPWQLHAICLICLYFVSFLAATRDMHSLFIRILEISFFLFIYQIVFFYNTHLCICTRM